MCHEKVGLKKVIHILEVLVRKKGSKDIFFYSLITQEKKLTFNQKFAAQRPTIISLFFFRLLFVNWEQNEKTKTILIYDFSQCAILSNYRLEIPFQIVEVKENAVLKLYLTIYNDGTKCDKYSDMQCIDAIVDVQLGCIKGVFLKRFVDDLKVIHFYTVTIKWYNWKASLNMKQEMTTKLFLIDFNQWKNVINTFNKLNIL